jgi:ureidoglycolate lyase
MPYGFFASMIDPKAEKIGAAPIEFYRDMLQQGLGGYATASFSTCRVEPREPVIDVTEFHTATAEGILPLDNDVLIHVAPATPMGSGPPLDAVRVFRVTKGTMVVIRPGIWHHAPFSVPPSL